MVDAKSSRSGELLSATPDEIRNRQRLINEIIFVLDRHVKTLRELKDVRKTNSDFTAEMKAWRGFTDPPLPYFVPGQFARRYPYPKA